MNGPIIEKHMRDSNDDIDYESEFQPSDNKRIKKEENCLENVKKTFKTMDEIKKETNDKYQNLTVQEKNNNDILFKLIENYDIDDNINLNILDNNLKAIKDSVDKLKTNTEIFINNYNKFRYTISTEDRKKLLNEYINITDNQNISDINFAYETESPNKLLQNFLLNILKLYNKCKLKKEKFSIPEFYSEFTIVIKNEGYLIGKSFFTPSNYGNINFRYSKVFEEFLKLYDNLFFDKNNNLLEESSTKLLFENKTSILYCFSKTVKNKDEILNEELYLKYLKIIYIIMLMCEGKEKDLTIIQKIKNINNCMINIINKEALKKYIKNNQNKLFIEKNGKVIEVNDWIINKLKLNEIVLYIEDDIKLNFEIKLYNNNVFDNLGLNIQDKNWLNCNFEYIENYHFLNASEQLKYEFKNNLLTILESPCVKEIYMKIETRFEKGYLFESENSKNIFEEIYKHIIFFPFPIETSFGYCNKNHYDIYINICPDTADAFNLFGELYANTNDTLHEVIHIIPLYYILNSENKKIEDANSRISSKTKKECVKKQQEFLKEIKSTDLRIKEKEDLDFGDLFEIELYGFYIREFSLKNTCELFVKDTWYKEQAIKNFKLNYINRSIKELEEKKENKENIDNCYEEKKEENKIENSNENQKHDINNITENSLTLDNSINIEDYKNKSKIIKAFFDTFPIKEGKKIFKNKQILVRKRGSFRNEKFGNILVRELRVSRNKFLPYNEFGGRRMFKSGL